VGIGDFGGGNQARKACPDDDDVGVFCQGYGPGRRSVSDMPRMVITTSPA
jgi:hypothetical protein